MKNLLKSFAKLVNTVKELREKCPWDKKQSWESLRHLTIEEVFELSDDIINNNIKGVEKELGDILLHILFYAQIAKEKGFFTLESLINKEVEKLIHRHPHIYGNIKVKDENQVKTNWEKLKLKEGNNSILSGVPKALPPLLKAYRIQEKVKNVGFDWDNKQDILNKINEEIKELEKARTMEEKEEELGDILFSIVNYARFININPDNALEKANKKFINRFIKLETEIKNCKKQWKDLDLKEMDKIWQDIKKKELKK